MNTRWQSTLEEGIAAIRQRQPERALGFMEIAYNLAPRERDTRYWLANAYRANGNTQQAARIFNALIAENTDDTEAAFGLAFLLREQGELARCTNLLLDTAGRVSDNKFLADACGFLRDINSHDAAIIVQNKLVGLAPDVTNHAFHLARLYQEIGDFGQAEAWLRHTLARDDRHGAAWISLAQHYRFNSREEEAFTRLVSVSEADLNDETRMCVSFAMGKALADLEDWSGSWRCYSRGNAIASKMHVWSGEQWQELVARKLAIPAHKITAAGHGRSPVFIVGNLRAGTTLLQDLLSNIPGAVPRGELNLFSQVAAQFQFADQVVPAQAELLSADIWKQLCRGQAENRFFIDNNPLNFRHLDLVYALFPEAKVIHVTRDGRDSCLSCFTQLFQHPDAAFSNNLDALVEHYAGYRKLMRRWEDLYGDRIYTVSYEHLVQSPSAVITGLRSFFGAEPGETGDRGDKDRRPENTETAVEDAPRPAHTAAISQSRQGVHNHSVGRWQRYAGQAPEFFARIAEIDGQYSNA